MSTHHWDQVKAAKIAFEARWLPSSLEVVDRDLYDRFCRQRDLWDQAYAIGHDNEIEIQAGGMVRAYEAATKRLEGHRMTAFLIGHDHERGRTLCVSGHSESVPFAEEFTEYPVTWMTPDACARLVGQAMEMNTAIGDTEDRLS